MSRCQGVIGVAKSGGWVTPQYPQRLYQDTNALILTDMDLPFKTLPFHHDWGGWWCKMEIMRPDIKGDWLYMDMDTLVIGDIQPLLDVGQFAMLGDYYRPKLESGVMYLTEEIRAEIWEVWIANPQKWMAIDLRNTVSGLHSYKVNGLRNDTRLLIYHGQPRPHETTHWLRG